MLATLGDPILPIFSALLLGYLCCKARVMDVGDARSINRFVFYLAAPAIGISTIGRAAPGEIAWGPTLVYFATEIAVYAAVYTLMRRVFGRDRGESLVLGMTTVFANHVFFVLPLAQGFYDDAQARMSGIVLLDIAVLFVGTVFLAEVVTRGGGVGATARRLWRNPFTYAPPVGIALGILGDGVPSGIWTFLDFTSAAAAPVVLFSLGITLAASPIWPVRLPCWCAALAKIAVVPAMVWMGTRAIGADAPIPLLVAAGPCGTLPYVIATQYDIRTASLAKTIFVSTLMSLVTLSLLLP